MKRGLRLVLVGLFLTLVSCEKNETTKKEEPKAEITATAVTDSNVTSDSTKVEAIATEPTDSDGAKKE